MNKKGFTLLELIIVLIIISLSITLIIPKISQKQDKILKSYAKNLCSFFKTARYTSLFRNEVVEISFNNKKKFFLMKIKNDKLYFKIKDKAIKVILKYPDSFPIYFYPIGTGTPFCIVLQKNNSAIKINFNSVNGKFSIEKI